MPTWAIVAAVVLAVFWLGMSLYGEPRRKTSAFWRGWTDVSGWRIFGLNRDK